MQDVHQKIQDVISELFNTDISVVLTRPDPQFGDLTTNVALQLSKQFGKNPTEVANKIVAEISNQLSDYISEVSVAGPGFVNIRLSDNTLIALAEQVTDLTQSMAGKVVVAEYSDPNPFKILHAGHLYTSIVGDSIANLLQAAGANVHRVNFGGDVGLHVGRTIWAILQDLGGEYPEKLPARTKDNNAQWLGEMYIAGNNAYQDVPGAKEEIIDLNKKIYQLHIDNDHDSALAQIYWTCRGWSYLYFDDFYKMIGTKFEKYYPESEVTELGLEMVKKHIKPGIFEESDGAIIFRGEPYGLHTRVFINSNGLATYEAKDVGLLFKKKQEYNFDISVVITGNEQQQYMAVVLKAVEQFAPELVKASMHLTHGIVKLQGGVKMSSRKGNILRAVDVLEAAAQANEREDKSVTLGAVKYAFLKVRTGGDIVYNPKESVSLEGNSGPYLQYAHARACSIIAKAGTQSSIRPTSLEAGERTLLNKLTEYREVVELATKELSPHIICTYLYELAQVFNRFYEHNRVIDDPRQAERLQLVSAYASVLKNGLGILGISAPEKM